MSTETCPHCGETLSAGGGDCRSCGAPVGRAGNQAALLRSGIHPAAPIVFLLAAGAALFAGILLFSVTFAIPLALFGGGIGVWVLERGRRLL